MSIFLSHGSATVLDCLVKETLVLLAAALACLLLRRSSAATRHLVWSTALGGVLFLPLLSLSLPRWQVAWRTVAAKPAPISPIVPAPSMIPTPITTNPAPVKNLPTPKEGVSPVSAPDVPVPSAPMPKQRHPLFTATHFAEMGIVVWIIGSLVVLGQFAVGLCRINIIRKGAESLDTSSLLFAEAARQQLGLNKSVEFIKAAEGSSIAIPVTWGILHPIVLLPPQASQWSEDCLRAALLHELAHVSRKDWPTQIMTRIVCALYWWHPLVWWAAQRAREESERACDDLVLGTGMKAADYAQRLVEVVRSLPAGKRIRTVAIAMAQPLEVEGRIAAVLATGRNRNRLSPIRIVLTFMAVLILLVPLSALHPVARAQATKSAPVSQEQAVTRRQVQGILEFVYLKDVATSRYPSRPLIFIHGSDGRSGRVGQFQDRKTGKTFRDGQHIQAVFNAFLAQGYKKRPDALLYLIPLPLSIDVPTRAVFFTPVQRQMADELEREKEAWIDFIQKSPIIATDADIEPRTTASLNSQKPPMPIVDIHFTPEGAKKMAAFTAAHQNEDMGIILNGSLVEAPRISGPINDEAQISGGFHTLADAQALAQLLNRPAAVETVSPDYYRSVSPDGKVIIETKGGAADKVTVAQGYSATLPNRYSIEITSIMQPVAEDGEWNMNKGTFWEPNGAPLPQPLQTKHNTRWSWRVSQSDGLTPYVVNYAITPATEGADVSAYEEFLGTANPDGHFSFWRESQSISGGTLASYFPKDAKNFSARFGVAVGPWQTVGTMPFHLTPAVVKSRGPKPPVESTDVTFMLDDKPKMIYQDAQGRSQIVYFLGKDRALANVARRLVAVDNVGQIIPLRISGMGGYGLEFYDFSFAKNSQFAVYNPKVNLAQVKEFRLQTRPYQIVEFQNIQLQSRVGSAVTESASASEWQRKEEVDQSNMRHINTLITMYTQDNDGKLPSLKTLALFEKDLHPYVKFHLPFPDPRTGQPFPDLGKDLFISPLTGKPYRLTAGLSNAPIAKIGSPAFTVLFTDTPITNPRGTQWLVEAFADGHVSGRAIP